ncbi:MAG: hypothetical protein Q9196_007459, partial [Gyalolechia fulgens]
IQEQTLAEDHPARLASQYALVGAYQANGQAKEAVSLLEQVVQIEEQTPLRIIRLDRPHSMRWLQSSGILNVTTLPSR